MPWVEVYRGDECIHAGVDAESAAQSVCIVTPVAVSCAEDDGLDADAQPASSRALFRLRVD